MEEQTEEASAVEGAILFVAVLAALWCAAAELSKEGKQGWEFLVALPFYALIYACLFHGIGVFLWNWLLRPCAMFCVGCLILASEFLPDILRMLRHHAAAMAPRQKKPCPACAEMIFVEAVKCRHCFEVFPR